MYQNRWIETACSSKHYPQWGWSKIFWDRREYCFDPRIPSGRVLFVATVSRQFKNTKVSYTVNQLATMCAVLMMRAIDLGEHENAEFLIAPGSDVGVKIKIFQSQQPPLF